MSDADVHRQIANALLDAAANTISLHERSNLIDEAVRWHMRAVAADEREAAWLPPGGAPDASQASN